MPVGGAHTLVEGRIRLRKGRIRQTVERIRLPKTCAPPSLGRSHPLANVRALPSAVRAPYIC
jgi:hypothetical protein